MRKKFYYFNLGAVTGAQDAIFTRLKGPGVLKGVRQGVADTTAVNTVLAEVKVSTTSITDGAMPWEEDIFVPASAGGRQPWHVEFGKDDTIVIHFTGGAGTVIAGYLEVNHPEDRSPAPNP